jgi:hypothetical protein
MCWWTSYQLWAPRVGEDESKGNLDLEPFGVAQASWAADTALQSSDGRLNARRSNRLALPMKA